MSHQTGSRTPWRDTYVGFCQYNEFEEASVWNLTMIVVLVVTDVVAIVMLPRTRERSSHFLQNI